MLVNVGLTSVFLSFLLCLYAIAAAIYGAKDSSYRWVDSARHAMQVVFPTLSFAVLCLVLLLLSDHYEVEYVSSVVSSTMPFLLKITALWGGQAGSLLFWSWLMAVFASAVTFRDWRQDREYLPWVIVVISFTIAFFLFLTLFFENPFRKLWLLPTGEVVSALFSPPAARIFVPDNGSGLNPLLRHPGMILHPPLLYLGFVSFVIPFAFAIAALILGRSDDYWIRITRRWTLLAWLFLSLGLLLGARWAYDVLGWGGYWGWDPVEIAALIPWLSGTALLHSTIIQERRGMLKRWNMVLIILTYALIIFGTFLTRSGVLSSVHAFAQSAIGPSFFIFIGITFIVSLALLLHRWNDLSSDVQITSLFSREALFLYNNLIFMGILVVCFWGMLFPLISELFTGQKVTVGPPFYERATAPLFAALLLLMGIAPISAWGYSTARTLGLAIWKPGLVSLAVVGIAAWQGVKNWGALLGFWLVTFVLSVIFNELLRSLYTRSLNNKEYFPLSFWRLIKRHHRRYGGYIIHIGIVLIALGILGIELFQTETQGTVAQGEQINLAGYTIVYDSLTTFDTFDGRNIARAVIQVYKNGQFIDELYPRRDFYYDFQQPMTIPGLNSTWTDDLYVILVDWMPISREGATFKIFHNPLVTWLWMGGFLLIIGTIIAFYPTKEFEYSPISIPQKSILSQENSNEPKNVL